MYKQIVVLLRGGVSSWSNINKISNSDNTLDLFTKITHINELEEKLCFIFIINYQPLDGTIWWDHVSKDRQKSVEIDLVELYYKPPKAGVAQSLDEI